MDIETNIQIKEVCDTTVILRELNAAEKVKQEAYYREKRLYDEASDLGSARREGIEVGYYIHTFFSCKRWNTNIFRCC